MEVEEMRETLEKQKSQLQILMGYSKNLKSRNEQLVDRQELLRNLLQKLKLQEKALVRFIRMNYDGKFMPESAYL
jgi:small-conductance mechanosensitive channel